MGRREHNGLNVVVLFRLVRIQIGFRERFGDRGMNKRIVQLSLALLLSGACSGAALAANPVAPAADINANDLNILEHRFFSHAYAHDPLEKRLERLECLVYGSTRDGSNAERLARLSKTVATRSQQPLVHETAPAPVDAAQGGTNSTAKAPTSSKQYPILNTLEWKALKKTFPNESLDQRLDRLESKMFGQPAQTMAYVDRVERLKRTVGIGLETQPNDHITSVGPKPKAKPNGMTDDGMGGMQMPLQTYVPPTMGLDLDPFGGTTFGGSLRPFQQLMQSMDKQMSQQLSIMRELGPGHWVLDPKSNEWVEINSGKRVSPGGKSITVPPQSGKIAPSFKPKTTKVPLPFAPESGQIREIPGYADPNSI